MEAKDEIYRYLREKSIQYNNLSFIENDPICIPHAFSNRDDIEIAAFLAATLAWGQRKAIIGALSRLMHAMGDAPADFVRNYSNQDLFSLQGFVYRTFNHSDAIYFIRSLQYIQVNYGGISNVFKHGYSVNGNIRDTLMHFRKVFTEWQLPAHSGKHIADVGRGAAGKRLNMFLRWMVRNDNNGVDFGIWDFIPVHDLMIPLDVHTGTVARNLGLLSRKQNDWKAVEELTAELRIIEPHDPVWLDYGLFGIGVNHDL